MATYTNIPKPVGTSYTNQNTIGKQQYDQASIMYDDPSVFYDGVNVSAYTNVAKPQIIYGTLIAGIATGLLVPLTRSSVSGLIEISPYTNVAKPI